MDKTSLKAIIFDFFGVIGEEIAWSWYKKNKHRIPTHETELADLLKMMDVGLITPDDMFDLLSSNSGLPAKEIKEAMIGKPLQINEEVIEIIKKLRGRHKVALLSNAHREWLEGVLQENSLSGYFDYLFISSDLGLAKPDPEIFEIALKKLGISAHDSYFIDDTSKNIVAAEKVGINAIHFVGAKELSRTLQEEGLLD